VATVPILQYASFISCATAILSGTNSRFGPFHLAKGKCELFFFFSNRLGCLGSLLISTAITIGLLFMFGVFR
jgi:hypothetical protein